MNKMSEDEKMNDVFDELTDEEEKDLFDIPFINTDFTKKDFSFADSWKDKTVQLVAGTALVAGGGGLIAKGRMPKVVEFGGKALKRAGKNAEKYIMRRSNKQVKALYPMGKSVFRDLKNQMSKFKDLKKKTADELTQEFNKRKSQLDPKKVEERAFKIREQERQNFELNEFKKLSRNPDYKERKFRNQPLEYYLEKAEQEMVEAANPANQKQPKKKFFNKENMGDLAAGAVGTSAAGLGFASGISLFHSFDKNPSAQNTYEAAGSFLKDEKKQNGQRNQYHQNNQRSNGQRNQYNNQRSNGQQNQQRYRNNNQYRHNNHQQRGNTPMKNRQPNDQFNKQAGARDFYDAFIGKPSGKVGGAVLTGTGFGAASYMMNKANERKRKEEEEQKQKNRIVIEFGAEDEIDTNPMDGGTKLLHRPTFQKKASVSNFLRNMSGRRGEIRNLESRMKDHDYSTEAADYIKQNYKNPAEEAQKRFSHVLNEDKAKERFLDSQAKMLREQDARKIDNIQEEVAKARLTGIGGLGAIGLTGAGINSMRKGDEEE